MSTTWVVPPEWTGETAFLLGCGPSLARTPLQELPRHGRVIAINDAFLRLPSADVLYFCDRAWWKRHSHLVHERFTGRWIVTLRDEYPGVKTLRCTGELGLEEDPGALRHGSNSGYQAINLAFHFGATRIVLLGYDMQVVDGWRMHHAPRSWDRTTPEAFQRVLLQKMLPKFQSLVAPLREAGVEVLNATPGSRLTLWPRVALEEVLSGRFLLPPGQSETTKGGQQCPH